MKRLGLVVAALVATIASAAADDGSMLRSVTLPNGLQVLVVPDLQSPAADVAVWYRAGVRMEPAGKSGLSALMGRLMFRGSKRFGPGEHQRLVEAEGGAPNTLINPDYSCFYQTVSAGSVERALELEADRMASLQLTPEAFEAERKALREQRRRTEGAPLSRAVHRLYATAYGEHPYARPASGVEQDLERITFADVETWYRERYGPGNAVLTVVGGVDPEATLEAIRRHFGPVPKRSTPPPAPAPSMPKGHRRDAWTLPSPSPILLMSWLGPGKTDPASPAFELLSQMVAGGPSSRLQRLRSSRPEFLLVQGDSDLGREASLLFCVAGVKAGSDSARAESTLVAEVEKIGHAGFTEDELERAKRRIEAATLFGMQTARGRAKLLGTAEVLEGDPRLAMQRLDRIRALTATDVRKVAASTLQADRRTTLWIGPPGSFSQPASKKLRRKP